MILNFLDKKSAIQSLEHFILKKYLKKSKKRDFFENPKSPHKTSDQYPFKGVGVIWQIFTFPIVFLLMVNFLPFKYW